MFPLLVTIPRVQGHQEHANLAWPKDQAVSFKNIRVKGAFTVSVAAAIGAGDKADGSGPARVKLNSAVEVVSHAGRNLTLAWWAGAKPSVFQDGVNVNSHRQPTARHFRNRIGKMERG